jgi:hypothetical protein
MRYYADHIFVLAGEDLEKNDLVAIVDSSGTMKAYKADAENIALIRPAIGFAVYDIAENHTGKVWIATGIMSDVTDVDGSELTVNAPYYLSGGTGSPDGRGKIQDTPGTGLEQFIGHAIDTDKLIFSPSRG